MKTCKYYKQSELQEVFKIKNDELYRKNLKTLLYTKVQNVSNTKRGYCLVGFKGKLLKYHAIVWILLQGDIPPGFVIDHIDGNSINNHISNLRLVTQRQNSQNLIAHRNGKLPGCTYDKRVNRWQAKAKLYGKCIHIGMYATEQEAHDAYRKFLQERGVA